MAKTAVKRSLVIVEDDENIALAEQLILQDQFTVHVAKDGEEGLALVRKHKPHAVVLDVMMPRLNGYEVCKKIREDTTLKHTKVVMVTAKDQQKDETKGLDTGADDYIMKPFEPAELLHVVNQVLE
ncbi:MAG: response regulator [Candidatus Woesearchaeota archaeon]|nr:response regulator [Candidatus Woesearchaeota archaeon]